MLRAEQEAATRENRAENEGGDENEFVEWTFGKFIAAVVRWPQNGPPSCQDVEFWVDWANSSSSCATMEGALEFLAGGGTTTMISMEEGKR